MRISDWSSDVCSSDLKRLIGEFSRDADSRKSQRLNFTALQQLEGLIIQRAVLHLPRVGGPADLLLFDALAEHGVGKDAARDRAEGRDGVLASGASQDRRSDVWGEGV